MTITDVVTRNYKKVNELATLNYTDYTFNLVQFRPSLIALVSSCIGINHCKFIKQLWAI